MEISDQQLWGNNWSGDDAEMLWGSDYNFQWFHRSNNLSSKTQNLISLVVKDNEFA